MLITGGAHGIGRALVRAFARNGYSTHFCDLNAELGEKLATELNAEGRVAHFHWCDLSQIEKLPELVRRLEASIPYLNALIHNARPRLKRGPLAETLSEWDLGVNVLLRSPLLLTSYLVPLLAQAKNASVIHVSSTNARFVSQQSAVYHVAKAGLDHATRFLACELGHQRIRVNGIAPGLVDIHDDNKALTNDPLHKSITVRTVPLQRAAETSEIADCALFLCSEKASYITGQTIVLDGGLTARDHFLAARDNAAPKP